MIHENHKSSKVIFLRRSPISLMETASADNAETKPYFDAAYRAIGSYWSRKSNRPATGLTLPEENLIMPFILDIPETDRDFRSRCTDYFHAISTKVEPTDIRGEGGTPLQIGLQDNEQPLSKDNLPLEPEDYVKWRHALGHPQVALKESLAKGNKLKQFYIFDPATETLDANNKADIKDEALTAYLQVKEDLSKTKQYLTLLNADMHLIRGKESIKLREFAETSPRAFLEVHNDRDRQLKFLIRMLVDAKVLEHVGTRLTVVESGHQIGATEKEAIAYLRDPENGQQLNTFKHLAQDYLKKVKLQKSEIE